MESNVGKFGSMGWGMVITDFLDFNVFLTKYNNWQKVGWETTKLDFYPQLDVNNMFSVWWILVHKADKEANN